MLEVIGCQYPREGKDLLGILEYYEAVLKRDGLVNRYGEFRSVKLGLILDLLKMVRVPEDLKGELITSVISAWRMTAAANTLPESQEELNRMLGSIETFRNELCIAFGRHAPDYAMQLDIPVLSLLPLLPTDLKVEDVPKIYSLLSSMMDYFAKGLNAGTAGIESHSG